ncbi:Aste57867_24990 [Aphanomyces stellatus]|uniref:Aste57867_24990 protein n=1 Tax=Aphanomyces stellatus TaxID=120398 RepID=A0A485LTB8_9STRA|nr:hypothetical protein As57867_024912 [Aphanomyces stellatus]VFU01621.1 Aste57867_24990 [Aphanomyces stellatus]
MCSLLARLLAAAVLVHDAAAQLTSFPLCQGNPVAAYKDAVATYPQVKNAVAKLSQFQVASWWTDNNAHYYTEIQKLLNVCNASTVPTIVVYGLPNKDCASNFSALGTNRNADDYAKFVQDLADLVGTRPVNYILEPDALGLVASNECATKADYVGIMMMAVPILTGENANASLYLDVGYWVFADTTQTNVVVQAVKQLGSKGGSIRGIALDTSNYRPTAEMKRVCAAFTAATKAANMKQTFTCVVDTSRNYIGPPATSLEWCNSRHAAIGNPPTSNTSSGLIDYYLWIKAPGDSDGPCNTADITPDALKNGPPAGQFFEKAFSLMWDRGYFVDQKLGDKLGEFTLDVDQVQQGGSISWVAIGVIVAACVVLVVVGVLVKRRSDARTGRRQHAAEAGPTPARKPYLSI